VTNRRSSVSDKRGAKGFCGTAIEALSAGAEGHDQCNKRPRYSYSSRSLRGREYCRFDSVRRVIIRAAPGRSIITFFIADREAFRHCARLNESPIQNNNESLSTLS
jgi:hypothetical protein